MPDSGDEVHQRWELRLDRQPAIVGRVCSVHRVWVAQLDDRQLLAANGKGGGSLAGEFRVAQVRAPQHARVVDGLVRVGWVPDVTSGENQAYPERHARMRADPRR